MHQEISKREKVSAGKLGLSILVAAVILISLNTVLVTFNLNSSLTDMMIMMSTAVLTYIFIKQNMISYKYCLIDDELIIHEVIGSKEKRILNMNLHQITRFQNVRDIDGNDDKSTTVASKKKLYNCINTKNRHYIIYEQDNEKHWITIQPSDCLIEMIRERMS